MKASNVIAIIGAILTLAWEAFLFYEAQKNGLINAQWDAFIGDTFGEWVEIILFVFAGPVYVLGTYWEDALNSGDIVLSIVIAPFAAFLIAAPYALIKDLVTGFSDT